MSKSDAMRILLFAILALVSVALPAAETSGIIAELVRKCDLIDDEYMAKKSGADARKAIMRCVRGKIGIISYESEIEKKMGGGGGNGSFGSAYSGNQGVKIFPPGGEYRLVTPANFDKTVAKWKSGHKDKDAAATAELAAALFTEAYKGTGGSVSESTIYRLFKTAADKGDADAMFMSGVCLYYGIGTTKNKKLAYKRLEEWKIASGTTKAKRGGWIARRFEVINQ